jgi:hypothetical protein
MRWKLGALAVATAVLLFVLVTPMLTLTVSINIPPPPSGQGAPQVYKVSQGMLWTMDAVVIGSVIVGAGFVARRIVQRHRNSNRSARVRVRNGSCAAAAGLPGSGPCR